MSDKQFIQQAISLATENVKVGGRPFGAVIVKNGQVIAHAVNQITATHVNLRLNHQIRHSHDQDTPIPKVVQVAHKAQ